MIINVEESCFEYITTDDEEFPEWRRYSGGTWECLMGMSWEQLDNEELEREYQKKQGRIK